MSTQEIENLHQQCITDLRRDQRQTFLMILAAAVIGYLLGWLTH